MTKVIVTLTKEYFFEDYVTPENQQKLINEWFYDKRYPLHIQSTGHAYRDGSQLGLECEVIKHKVVEND